MAFSILTNIASMQAQQYLSGTERFQNKTINRVTSGLRIVASGDDAAGLAIANSFRSDVAVLSQGIRNANDGLSVLQTIDGGINNISHLLDRARSLAAQSASGLFNGDRNVLNSEFQSVIQEIDRQAQVIGLDAGGTFAKSLSVFIGGGRANNGVSAISNGSVSVDLSRSTVDAKSLGLKGTQALGDTDVDLSAASATSVQAIVGNATNTGSLSNAGYSEFVFRGPAFGDDGITVSVNLSGVTDMNTLVTNINAAIDAAGNGVTSAATAFKNAGVRASVHTSSDGSQQLAFSSPSAAFQVEAGDRLSNALLGNLAAAGAPAGHATLGVVNSGGAYQTDGLAFADISDAANAQTITLSTNDANGNAHSIAIVLDDTTGADLATAIETINAALQSSNNPSLQKIVAVNDGSDNLQFLSAAKFQISIGTNGDPAEGITDNQGEVLTAAQTDGGSTAAIDTQAGAAAAVNALAESVKLLGAAQAVVGRGQNQFTFAVNLASSQLTNLAASESRIRDADLAAEAANLAKAQIALQAGVAALAQANLAPQQILSLLR
jgi:flagellin-like hook-associated protein FlgL